MSHRKEGSTKNNLKEADQVSDNLLKSIKEVREESDFTEVNELLIKGWLLIKISTFEHGFLYILART